MGKKLLNPATNRFVMPGTQLFKRLVNEGVFPEQEAESQAVEEIEQVEEIEKKLSKAHLAQVMTTEVASHIANIPADLAPEELDALLRKLLLEKLAPKKPAKAAKKPVKKKKKKARFVVAEPSSSDESSSEESESDSD